MPTNVCPTSPSERNVISMRGQSTNLFPNLGARHRRSRPSSSPARWLNESADAWPNVSMLHSDIALASGPRPVLRANTAAQTVEQQRATVEVTLTHGHTALSIDWAIRASKAHTPGAALRLFSMHAQGHQSPDKTMAHDAATVHLTVGKRAESSPERQMIGHNKPIARLACRSPYLHKKCV